MKLIAMLITQRSCPLNAIMLLLVISIEHPWKLPSGSLVTI